MPWEANEKEKKKNRENPTQPPVPVIASNISWYPIIHYMTPNHTLGQFSARLIAASYSEEWCLQPYVHPLLYSLFPY